MMGTSLRIRVEVRDVPPEGAARRLGLPLAVFSEKLPALYDRGFPRPDDVTGHFDLDAIDAWRRLRNPHLFGLQPTPTARDARQVVAERLRKMVGNG